MKQKQIILSIFLSMILVLTISSVSAWCLYGIGDTCGIVCSQNGNYCDTNNDCCSGKCNLGTTSCVAPTSSDTIVPNGVYACSEGNKAVDNMGSSWFCPNYNIVKQVSGTKVCENGVCVATPTNLLTCSGGNSDYKIASEVFMKNNGVIISYSNQYKDRCSSNGNLLKYLCTGNTVNSGTGGGIIVNCANEFGSNFVCSNGACINNDGSCASGYERCENNGQSTCVVPGNCHVCPVGYTSVPPYCKKTCSSTSDCASEGNGFICSNGFCVLGSSCKLENVKSCDGATPCIASYCEDCGYYAIQKSIPNPLGGDIPTLSYKCSLTKPLNLETCKSCDDFSWSFIKKSIGMQETCESKSWTFEFSLGLFPQSTLTCGLSLVKLILTPIIFIFSLLFGLDYVSRFKSLKGKNKKLLRFGVSVLLALIISFLVYTVFIFGLIIFVVLLAIKMGVKSFI